jgi:hypothetical protein
VTEMPVGMNGPRAAVDARHNMKAPTQPEDPDDRLHAAWFAEASSTDGLLAKQVPKQGGGSTSLSTSSLVPVCRLPGEEVRPAPPRRSGVIMIISIGFIFAAAAVAVISIPPHLSLLEVWRSATGGPTIDELASSEPLPSATTEMGNEPGTPKLIVEPSVGVAGEPTPIRLALRGRANDAVVIISGLIPGMELSTGSAITSDSWQLSASDLPYASIAPPQDFVGSADLVAELRLPNAQIADRQMLHLEWTRPAAVPELQHEQEQITRQKEVEPVPPIAPPTVAHSNDRDVTTAAPPNSADPLQAQLGRKEGKSARAREKNNLRRSSVNDGSPAASASPRVGDNTRPVKGFWDWSR